MKRTMQTSNMHGARVSEADACPSDSGTQGFEAGVRASEGGVCERLRLKCAPQTAEHDGLSLTHEPQSVERESLRPTHESLTVAHEGLKLKREP